MDLRASAFLESRTGGLGELLDIVIAPKVILSPWRDRSASAPSLAARMHTPNLPIPAAPPDVRQTALTRGLKTQARRVHEKIARGHVRQAARQLGGAKRILPLTDATLLKLRSKYPPARAGITFGRVGQPAPSQLRQLDANLVRATARSFRKDAGGGCGGWTVPLLQLATKGDRFCEFIIFLSRAMAAGTAPGRLMLSAAQLLPLEKANGDVRPIAIGELIYRLCAKLLIAVLPLSDSLLPNQLGVGSPGGVEPVVRLADLLAEGRLPCYTHIVSLDAKNGFNALHRTAIDDGLHAHCPALYRFAKWRYGQPNVMIINGPDGAVTIEASEGVQQGDPFGPFFFSVALRSTIKRLQEYLGPDHIVVLYLDDGYVLSKYAGTLEKIQTFFREEATSTRPSGLVLNEDKCVEHSAAFVRAHGFPLAGTVVGSALARASLLRTAIDAELSKLDLLPSLARQDALLLLTQSLQHNLRHLLRCLRTDDLPDAWSRLDHGLHLALRRMRSSTPTRRPLDQALFSLPSQLGGTGVPLPSELAPSARAAAIQAASLFVRDRLCVEVVPVCSTTPAIAPPASPLSCSQPMHSSPPPFRPCTRAAAAAAEAAAVAAAAVPLTTSLRSSLPLSLPTTTPPEDDGTDEPLCTQRERTRVLQQDQTAALFAHPSFSREHAVAFEASKSRLARRWLTAIPFSPATRLDDRSVQVGLELRTLTTLDLHQCALCAGPTRPGHEEVCPQRYHHRTRRHNRARDTLARAVRTIPDTRIVIEPCVDERYGDLRTDLRIIGRGAPNGAATEVDLTFTSLATQRARRWVHHISSETHWARGLQQGARWCIAQHLEECARAKVQKYGGIASTDFIPMVFSLDGFEALDTLRCLNHWRRLMPSFSFLLDALSVLLLVTRAESFL